MDPKFVMQAAYPQLLTYFGIISSIDSLFSAFGILIGRTIDKKNRKNLLAGFLGACSIAVILSGSIHSILILCVARVVMGICSSAYMPTIFSLIQDMFPKRMRARANSLISCG